jgi:hypothetical protein
MTRRGPRDEPDVGETLATALRDGRLVRVHLRDGEVLVARVLQLDADELVYAAVRSSHPERYAVCDSTGFRVPRGAIERAALLRPE